MPLFKKKKKKARLKVNEFSTQEAKKGTPKENLERKK